MWVRNMAEKHAGWWARVRCGNDGWAFGLERSNSAQSPWLSQGSVLETCSHRGQASQNMFWRYRSVLRLVFGIPRVMGVPYLVEGCVRQKGWRVRVNKPTRNALDKAVARSGSRHAKTQSPSRSSSLHQQTMGALARDLLNQALKENIFDNGHVSATPCWSITRQ